MNEERLFFLLDPPQQLITRLDDDRLCLEWIKDSVQFKGRSCPGNDSLGLGGSKEDLVLVLERRQRIPIVLTPGQGQRFLHPYPMSTGQRRMDRLVQTKESLFVVISRVRCTNEGEADLRGGG